MKNKKLLYSLFLLPTLMLTACGYGLEEIVKSDVYDSTVFVNNYYTKWDKRIDAEHKDNQIDETSSSIVKLSSGHYFTKWQDYATVEPNFDKLVYQEGVSTDKGDKEIFDINGVSTNTYKYGQYSKLSAIEESFKYGVISKLYDGQLFCNGDTTKVRVQLAPMLDTDLAIYGYSVDPQYRSGFGHVFEKQYEGGAPYFAINFKNFIEMTDDMAKFLGVDSTSMLSGQDDSSSLIDVHISFYIKNNKDYIKKTVVCEDVKVSNNGKYDPVSKVPYTLLGFPLNSSTVDITNCAGISIEYKLKSVNDTYVNANEFINKMVELDLHYGMWLYEIILPYSTWH